MELSNKLNTLKENYKNQVDFFKTKIDEFKIEEGLKLTDIRTSYKSLALYVDKLNYYQNNLNKIEMLLKFLETGVVLSQQKEIINSLIGTTEQENQSLITFMDVVLRVN